MGNGMNKVKNYKESLFYELLTKHPRPLKKVLPGLYVGNYRDSKDLNQLEQHRITHILAIHDNPKHLFADKHYLCVMAADNPDQVNAIDSFREKSTFEEVFA